MTNIFSEISLFQSDLVDFWQEPRVNHKILAKFSGNSLQQFEKLGIAFEIAHQNITRRFEEDIEEQKHKLIARQRLFMSLNENEFIDSFSLDEYHSYDEIYEYLKNIQNRSNSTVGIKVISIGKTHEGRDIWALTIGKEALVAKKILALECNVHAREWVKKENSLKIISKFLTHFFILKGFRCSLSEDDRQIHCPSRRDIQCDFEQLQCKHHSNFEPGWLRILT